MNVGVKLQVSVNVSLFVELFLVWGWGRRLGRDIYQPAAAVGRDSPTCLSQRCTRSVLFPNVGWCSRASSGSKNHVTIPRRSCHWLVMSRSSYRGKHTVSEPGISGVWMIPIRHLVLYLMTAPVIYHPIPNTHSPSPSLPRRDCPRHITQPIPYMHFLSGPHHKLERL